MKKIKSFMIFGFIISLFSCATTVTYKTNRPAAYDLNCARSILIESVITPRFNSYGVNNDDSKLAGYMENALAKEFRDYNYYTVYTSRDRRVEPDVYLDGEILFIDVTDNESRKQIENPDYIPPTKGERRVEKRGSNINTTEKYIYQYSYQREVHMCVRLTYVDAYTEKEIFSQEYDYVEKSYSVNSKSDLPSVYDLLYRHIDSIVSDIAYYVHPHAVTCKITLLENETKDKELDRAEDLADKGQLGQSYQIYKEYYDSTGLFFTGYNAALLQQAMGNLKQAKTEMEKVYKESGDTRALDALSVINAEVESNSKFEKQQAQRR